MTTSRAVVALPAPSTADTSITGTGGTANAPPPDTATGAPFTVTWPIPDASVALHVDPEEVRTGGAVSLGANSFAKASGKPLASVATSFGASSPTSLWTKDTRPPFPAIALRSEAMLLTVVPSARTLARRVTRDPGSRT